jgi:hypothetical protein
MLSDIEPAQPATVGKRKEADEEALGANSRWVKDFAAKSESLKEDEKPVARFPASPSSNPGSARLAIPRFTSA